MAVHLTDLKIWQFAMGQNMAVKGAKIEKNM
jgi:hypothetical protein